MQSRRLVARRARCENVNRFLNGIDGAFGGARAVRDQGVGVMEIEPADLTDAGRDQKIGRVAGEAVARAEPDGSTILSAPIVTTAFTPFMYKNLSFFAYGLNLSNEVFGFYQGSPNYPIQREFYKPTVAFGMRSWSNSVVAWNNGSDSNRFCIGRSSRRWERESRLIAW